MYLFTIENIVKALRAKENNHVIIVNGQKQPQRTNHFMREIKEAIALITYINKLSS